MKEIKNKITRYSTAVGALMAVSGAAIASPTPGTIMLNHTPSPLGYDGNAILDHNGDRVYIDMDNDGTPDFYAEMTQSGPMLNARLVAYNSFLNPLVAGESGSTIIKKYVSNEQIGTSFVNPLSSGVISSYSSLGDAQASALAETPTPLGASFVNTGDQGYIGVSLGNPGSAKYGWIQVEIGTNTQTVDFIACALESQANSAILAGSSQPVPVLPIASVAGMGLIGLMAAMKRRKKATV